MSTYREGGVRMTEGCYACRLAAGVETLPGGRLHATPHWVVEHCTGPLGLGTLIVKPLRHCEHVGDLTAEESAELGPLLALASRVTGELLEADQVYVCLWSHAGWRPGHVHFVVQPVRNELQAQHEFPGPSLQKEMFDAGSTPDPHEVETLCQRARDGFRRT